MLGIVIVAYKNPDRTADYINNQLPRLTNKYVVVVVNNASTKEDCESLAQKCQGIACGPDDMIGKHPVYIVHSEDNLGFAKGNNLGVRFLSRNYPCDHILFSNDDIIIQEGTDLQPMINLLERDKSIGAIGPDIVGLDGRHQSPHRKVITPYRQIGWMLFSKFRRRNNHKHEENYKPKPTPEEGICYWVSGAFFMMRFGHFSAVNGFDPDTFLYSEEPILAERLKRLGKSMYFYPKIQVTHLYGGSIKATYQSAFMRKLKVESNCIYYKKYLKVPKSVIGLYKWLELKHVN